jgi:ubiquinone/menaquinone biosynthesis C-methylase UbiE
VKEQLPAGYSSPTDLPPEGRRDDWQRLNRAWWEANPMRYDWRRDVGAQEFSAEFYREIDRRFFDDAAHYLPPRTRPFDRVVPFSALPDWDVLEIGVGSGSHAQLLAPSCRTYTGIDLTEYAVTSTRRRFDRFGVRGRIVRMDAEQLAFADRSFDFIWTWGVIHHSADTSRVLREMWRVLRPGGVATVMVYHRSWLYAYVYAALFRGVVLGGFRRHSLHELLQLHTDGAIARFYRVDEWRALVASVGFALEEHQIVGQKSEVIMFPAGAVKNALARIIPDAAARAITNSMRQGSFLVSTLRKPRAT